jgi:hypothetical protein
MRTDRNYERDGIPNATDQLLWNAQLRWSASPKQIGRCGGHNHHVGLERAQLVGDVGQAQPEQVRIQ